MIRFLAITLFLALTTFAAEKKKVWELVSRDDGASVADDHVEAMEHR